MRTKTLLLSAAALLAAGIVTSQAQSPVYSQNVVGYASIVAPSAFTLMTVPFQVGVSNGGNEVFGTSLPDGTQIYLWNATSGKFTVDYYDTGAVGPSQPWLMSDDATPTNAPILAPGQGFYLLAPGGVTNTFAGVVAVNVGATNTLALGSFFNLVGSVIPAAGTVSNSIINLGGPGTQPNGFNLPDGTQVFIYDSTHNKYVVNYFDTGAVGPSQPWCMSDDATPTNAPSVSVGQGLFILPPGGATWSQTLPSN